MNNIVITSLNPGDPDYTFEEFVVLENNSLEKICLDGWKIVWQEWPSQRILHEYTFSHWKSQRSFDPQEKMFVISGLACDKFYRIGESRHCPKAHWKIFTDTLKHICSVPHIKVTLYNDKNEEIDHLFSHQFKDSLPSHPVIVIGHGGNPAWRELQEHLRDQQGFEVEAFETAPRTSQTIPDVIAGLGSQANMAILVMTGEDEMADGSRHPRLNVVQELGKFQERFGSNKTIILSEEGVTIPSNNSGIIYISFETGNIRSCFGDIVAAIRREFEL
jgi:Holliday junction resolvase